MSKFFRCPEAIPIEHWTILFFSPLIVVLFCSNAQLPRSLSQIAQLYTNPHGIVSSSPMHSSSSSRHRKPHSTWLHPAGTVPLSQRKETTFCSFFFSQNDPPAGTCARWNGENSVETFLLLCSSFTRNWNWKTRSTAAAWRTITGEHTNGWGQGGTVWHRTVVIIGPGVIICPSGDSDKEPIPISESSRFIFGAEFLSLRSRVVTRGWTGGTTYVLRR